MPKGKTLRKKSVNSSKKHIEQYDHKDKKRVNNPPVGLVTPDTDKDAGKKKYAYDPHLDPQLTWAGKAEHTSFEVPTVSLHVHERIDPATITEAVKRKNGDSYFQASLFEELKKRPLREEIQFYKHKDNWTNRLIAGDSLLVMNSLIEKEGMAGQVQMVYIDPPYGIKYGSNFQPFVNKRDVKDGKDEDLTQEPEMVKAFRDTWELGIHSYLTYLRDRLLLSKELLSESGSIFVQISDENVHLVRNLLDEIFGPLNFVALIPFRKKTMPLGAKLIEQMYDFILWYAKDKETIKYRKQFVEYQIEGNKDYCWYQMPDGTEHQMTQKQINDHTLVPKDARIFLKKSLRASGKNASGMFTYKFKGKEYPSTDSGYCTNLEGMKNLDKADFLTVKGNMLTFKYFASDESVTSLLALWADTVGAQNKTYVVQTSDIILQRCILMTTDPGDLIFGVPLI